MHTQKLQRFDASELVRRRYHNKISSYASVARANRLSTDSAAVPRIQEPSEVRALKHTLTRLRTPSADMLWYMQLEHRREDWRRIVKPQS